MTSKLLSLFFLLMMWGLFCDCTDDKGSSRTHDPSQSIKITEFSPVKGAARTRLFIYGTNFGDNIEHINVSIGGLNAKVIGSNGECIYCVVPPRAFDGTIKVSVWTDSVNIKEATADDKFKYERKTMVSTLCGSVSETGEYTVKDGPFDVAGFKSISWLSADPKDPGLIYAIEEYASIRMLDLHNQMVSTLITNGQMNVNRPRTIAWTPDNDAMIVNNDQGSEDGISNLILNRDDAFLKADPITWSRSCNGTAVHPINGEIYFSQWEGGSIWRYDPKTAEPRQELFKVWANGYEIGLVFHPSGDYAYLIIHNAHCIVKCNYNWKEKKLDIPQPFAGTYERSGWVDGVGTSARFDTPWQGVFVKNDAYESSGRKDIYDFYLCDRHTCSIRKISPEGMVTTYAGRGSEGLDNRHWGYIDGDLRKEARFDQPCGIAYDVNTKTFFIADFSNHRIRTIVVEDDSDSNTED